jgi:hypothetical protein
MKAFKLSLMMNLSITQIKEFTNFLFLPRGLFNLARLGLACYDAGFMMLRCDYF